VIVPGATLDAPVRAGGGADLPPGPGGGLRLMAQAAFWFAVMGLLVKLASRTLPTMEIVFARGAITLVIASAVLWRARLSPFVSRSPLLLARGVIGSCAMICFYAAVVHLPLAEATVLHQTAPLFTAVFAAWLLRERLSPRVVAALAIAFAGVLLIARPGWLFGVATAGEASSPAAVPDAARRVVGGGVAEGGAVEPSWPFAMVGLASAVLSAVAYVTVRRLGRSENPLVVVFWLPLCTLPLAAPFALPQWVWPDASGWACLVGIGATTQIAQVALTKALAREAAGRATAVGYLQVAFATMFGAVVFGVWPDGWSWAGMALIVGSLGLASRR
jgi:drug/metabolite transporter (DMT)-like permease